MRLTLDTLDPVWSALDRRLSRNLDWPLAIAVSGGGDSVALMHLTAIWAQAQRRRLVVLNVDHGLNPEAKRWSASVRAAAENLGAEWRGLFWDGDKPKTGIQAAARTARHALLADGARAAGARVLLMGHTADDIAESDWMRRHGVPLGGLREWAPSPVWPAGRGLMLLRPLLKVRRAALRAWLSARGVDWIEDPANLDPRFLRSRARASRPEPGLVEPEGPPTSPGATVEPETGVVRIARDSPWLGHALICASGRSGAVTQVEVDRIRSRLEGDTHTISLAGTSVRKRGEELVLTREPGRVALSVQPLARGVATVWDGRFVWLADRDGWTVAPAAGHRALLTAPDRQTLNRLPASARGAHPVLFREDDPSPVLASGHVTCSCLVAERLRLATGQVQTEDDLSDAMAS